MLIYAPKNSANDVTVKVVGILVEPGGRVLAGQTVLEVETAKAVIEVAAPSDGEFHPRVSVGDIVSVGDVLAAIGDANEVAPPRPAKLAASTPLFPEGTRLSRSAAELIARHSLDAEVFRGRGLVTGAMVEAYLSQRDAPPAPKGKPVCRTGNGRLILLGAGPGAAQVMSALRDQAGTEVIGILDDDPAKADLLIHGARVIGTLDLLDELAARGEVDTTLCTTPTTTAFRIKVHELTRKAGLTGANVIHRTAVFDTDVTIGEGNFIGALCYFGAETQIGDYGFFSSRTTFEHHNRVGDGVTTGPNVATAGRVTVGNHVRFGGQVLVESNLTIGDGAILASGTVIYGDIPPGTTVRSRSTLR